MRTNPAHHPRRPGGTLEVDADHLLVVVSDVEMGAGGSTDDFPQTEFLGDLLLSYNRPPFADIAVTVVANGDFFDLLKTSVHGIHPTRITSRVALAKLERILTAHSAFFDQLGEFLAHDGAPRRLVFVAGNHDLELLFPEVQTRLATRIGVPSAIDFEGHSCVIGDVWIEHGSQKDPIFAVEGDRPFVDVDGDTILNISWGTLALLEVALPKLHTTLHMLDRIRPRRRVFEILPEVRELILQSYWHYWTRDYLRGLISRSSQLHRISWTMVKEVIYRLFTGDPELAGTDAYALIAGPKQQRTYVLGHLHSAGFWFQEGRRVIQTGCFRNEYLLDTATGDHQLLPKLYGEVYLKNDRTVTAHLVEVMAPRPAVSPVPKRIADVLPEVRRLLREHNR